MIWKSEPWLILDTESTEPNPMSARIVQLGAVWMRDGQMTDRRLVTINPGVPIPEGASAVHGITDERVSGAPGFGEVFPAVMGHLERATVLVTYNGSRFDLPLLVAEARRVDLSSPHDRARVEHGDGVGSHEARLVMALERLLHVDVLVQVKRKSVGRWWPGKGRHRLANVGQRMAIELPAGMRPHRADADCYLAGSILWQTIDKLPDDAAAVRELLADRAREQEEDYQSWRAQKGESMGDTT